MVGLARPLHRLHERRPRRPACIACIGSEADPRRHVHRDLATGTNVIVDCKACAVRVDAAVALGHTVVGVGLGGPGSHCDSVVQPRSARAPSLGAPRFATAPQPMDGSVDEGVYGPGDAGDNGEFAGDDGEFAGDDGWGEAADEYESAAQAADEIESTGGSGDDGASRDESETASEVAYNASRWRSYGYPPLPPLLPPSETSWSAPRD